MSMVLVFATNTEELITVFLTDIITSRSLPNVLNEMINKPKSILYSYAFLLVEYVQYMYMYQYFLKLILQDDLHIMITMIKIKNASQFLLE